MQIQNSPDFETKNRYRLLIEAADNGNPPKVAYARVKVIVKDVNDHKPQFNQSEYNFCVSEGTPVRRRIGSVYAVDRDSETRGRVVYTIKGGDGNAFTIDASTGENLRLRDHTWTTLIYICLNSEIRLKKQNIDAQSLPNSLIYAV